MDRKSLLWLIGGGVLALAVLSLVIFLTVRSGGSATERPDSPASSSQGPRVDETPQAPTSPSAPSSPTSEPSQPDPTESSFDEHGHDGDGHEDPATVKAKETTVEGYVDAWLKPGTTKERKASLLIYATDEAAEMGALVDNRSLPDATREGEVELAEDWDLGTVTLSDDTTWELTMVFDPEAKHQWLVTAMYPVR